MIQMDLFGFLDNETKRVAESGQARRPIPLGPISGTIIEVLKEVEPRRFGPRNQTERYVLIRCKCGTEKEVQLKHVRNRNTKSCGRGACLGFNGLPKVGDRFGSKEVIEVLETQPAKDSVVVCRCDCGTIKRYSAYSIKNCLGKCQSCTIRPAKLNFKPGDPVGSCRFIRECLGTHSTSGAFSRRILLECKCGKPFAFRVRSIGDTGSITCGCDRQFNISPGQRTPGSMLVFTGKTKAKPTHRGSKKLAEVKCDCGKTCYKELRRIRQGKIKSCGCLFNAGRRESVGPKYDAGNGLRGRVLRLANGKCECCNSVAPFIASNNKPYLEVHHVVPLGLGGWNNQDNAVALCPNCHKEIHHGKYGDLLADSLYGKVSRLRKCRLAEELPGPPQMGTSPWLEGFF